MDRATKDDKTSEMMSQKVDIALSFGWGSYTYIPNQDQNNQWNLCLGSQ